MSGPSDEDLDRVIAMFQGTKHADVNSAAWWAVKFKDIAQALAAVRSEERERCAGIAEACAATNDQIARATKSGMVAFGAHSKMTVGREIADEIRKG